MREFRELKFKGTQVAYAVICKRKLWLFSKGIALEHTSDKVMLGKVIDETTFKEEEGLIDENVSIDFLKSGDEIVVHEIKLSSAIEEAHELQVKYYIYYLRKKGVNTSRGIIHYPKARKIKEVSFTKNDEEIIEKALKTIDEILNYEYPPKVERKPYCIKCAYYEFCYG